MPRSIVLVSALLLFGFVVNACTTATCEEDETQCSGEQVQTCVDGVWSDATACDAGLTCQPMGDVEHCM